MSSKVLLATTALVVASSVAFANTHPVRPSHQSLATLKQLYRNALVKKGIVVNAKGVPLGVKMTAAVSKNGAIGKPAAHVPGSGIWSNFSKSKNALFLSWFGWFAGASNIQSGPFSGSFCYSYSGSYPSSTCVNHYDYRFSTTGSIQQSAAQPFKSKGGSASGISVGAEQYYGSGGATASIYTNSKGSCAGGSSCPGTAIASGSFKSAPPYTGLCCSGLETVTFKKPVTLNTGKYWVVLSKNGTGGRVAWNGQNSNFSAIPTGEDYNYTLTEIINSSYRTTRYGYGNTYHTSIHESSGGWIHTSSFSFIEQQAAFTVN